jgi:nicotinate-nucleotide adenylyltransferase
MNPPRWQDITAVFGGRFDPPHLGHREAVRGLFINPGIKQVIIVPSASPPHKPAVANAESRAEMARINFSSTFLNSFPLEVRIDTLELERSRQNPLLLSYSYDTLQELKKETPNLAFVIGADQLSQLRSWNRFPNLLGLSHWIVLNRKPDGDQVARSTLQEWQGSGLIRPFNDFTWKISNYSTYLTLVSTDAPNLSSTTIRESIIRFGTPSANHLLPEVQAYLKDHKLYGI